MNRLLQTVKDFKLSFIQYCTRCEITVLVGHAFTMVKTGRLGQPDCGVLSAVYDLQVVLVQIWVVCPLDVIEQPRSRIVIIIGIYYMMI